jgi:hypothetical protein
VCGVSRVCVVCRVCVGYVCGVCIIFPVLSSPVLCISSNLNLNKLYHVSLSTHSSPKLGILRLGGQ